MTIEYNKSNRGATVLLAELKALLDSFPQKQRTDVIETLKIVFRGLNADSKTCRSVHPEPDAKTVLTSPIREAPANADLGNKRHSENQKQRQRDER